MVTVTLQRVGDHYQVNLPKEEIEALGLREGQNVNVRVELAAASESPRPKVREAFEASWQRNEPGYRYLAGR